MTKLAFDAAFTPTSRTITPEGFLCVKGIAARTGVYEYTSDELGLEGPRRIVNVYRSPEAVFNADSLASYADKDVTNNHPDDLISSRTYKDHSVGHVQYGKQADSRHVEVAMIIKDQAAIDDVQSGKAELSPGYLAEYTPQQGVDPETGTPYEFVQSDIVINHVAIVEAARAGKQARIFDRKPKGANMTRKVVLDSKSNLAVTLDDDAASVVESAIRTKDAALADAAEALKVASNKLAAKDAETDRLKEDNEKLKAETSDSAIASRVAAISATTTAASKIVKGFDAKGSTNIDEIKRACMQARFPTRDWASKSASYVEAAFDAESEKDEKDDDGDKKEDGMTKDAQATLDGLGADMTNAASTTVSQGKKTSDSNPAYNAFLHPGAQQGAK